MKSTSKFLERFSLFRTNWYYASVVILVACGGIPKGYDEGGFSANVGLKSFKQDYNLIPENWENDESGLANRKANISSFMVLGSAFGAIIAVLGNDRLGRLRSWQIAVTTYMIGTFIQIFSSGIYGLILFARIFGGLGSGALTVIAPLYLSEIAPARTRGLVVSTYMVVLLTTLALGFFINYAADKHMAPTRTQYRLVQAIPLIPSGLTLIATFFYLPETPRYLASKLRHDEALEVLARLRGSKKTDPAVVSEFEEIDAQVRSKIADLEGVSMWSIFKEMQLNRNYRARFWLVIAMHAIAQWTGGNGITYWVPEIFQYAGVKESAESLISSGAYGIVKLVVTMAFSWVFIDRFGRRPCFLVGLFLQLAAHIYMAVYMGIPSASSNQRASEAAIASVFVYAVGWSIGLCTVPYLYGTELFPTRQRNVAYAINMSLHWFYQFAVVRVTPNMFVSLNVWGAYIFWACICFSGIVILGITAPETKGIPMERMGELFEGPWYLYWRAKPRPLSNSADMAPESKLQADSNARSDVEKQAHVESRGSSS